MAENQGTNSKVVSPVLYHEQVYLKVAFRYLLDSTKLRWRKYTCDF